MSPERLVTAVRAALDTWEQDAHGVHDHACAEGMYRFDAPCFCERPAAVLRQVAAYREILAEHSVIWRHTLYYADDDDAEHEPELPVCETCVPRHSSFKSRADVPLWPCKTVRSLARGLGIDLEEEEQ